MIDVNKEVVSGLNMIQLRSLYTAICGEKLKAWISIEEARKEIYNKVYEENKKEPVF